MLSIVSLNQARVSHHKDLGQGPSKRNGLQGVRGWVSERKGESWEGSQEEGTRDRKDNSL